jgi:acetolactate synthase-1/2/3 large subunit
VGGTLGDAPGAAIVGPAGPDGDLVAGVRFARQNRAPVIVLGPAGDGGEASDDLQRLVKGSWPLTPASAGHQLAHAARLALTDPRGPVRLTVASDELETAAIPLAAVSRAPAPAPPDPVLLDRAAELIRAGSRPVVVAGRGCRREDTPWLRAFMEAMPAPVLTTATARGVVPEPHPLALGVLDSEPTARCILERADLIITVGLEPEEARGWGSAGATAHVDLARNGQAPFGRPAARVVGEPGAIFAELAERIGGRSRADWDVAALDRMKRGSAGPERSRPGAPPDSQAGQPDAPLCPVPRGRDWPASEIPGGPGESPDRSRIVHLARTLTPAGTIAAFDGGKVWSAQRGWQAVELGDCLVPFDRLTPGTAIPSAIGAALAFPSRPVLAFVDAQGLLVVAPELTTIERLGLAVVVVVFACGAGGDVSTIAQRAELAVHEADDGPAAERVLATALATTRPAVMVVRGAAAGEPSP